MYLHSRSCCNSGVATELPCRGMQIPRILRLRRHLSPKVAFLVARRRSTRILRVNQWTRRLADWWAAEFCDRIRNLETTRSEF